MGQAVDMETVMSNFQEVAGIQMPHQIETRSGGQVIMTMTIDKIEPNVTLEDSLFALPK
jgi:outer membrane lipoprotein-sorting protein